MSTHRERPTLHVHVCAYVCVCVCCISCTCSHIATSHIAHLRHAHCSTAHFECWAIGMCTTSAQDCVPMQHEVCGATALTAWLSLTVELLIVHTPPDMYRAPPYTPEAWLSLTVELLIVHTPPDMYRAPPYPPEASLPLIVELVIVHTPPVMSRAPPRGSGSTNPLVRVRLCRAKAPPSCTVKNLACWPASMVQPLPQMVTLLPLPMVISWPLLPSGEVMHVGDRTKDPPSACPSTAALMSAQRMGELQSESSTEPGELVVRPAGQTRQEVEPGAGWYLEMRQEVQTPASRYSPAAQPVQSARRAEPVLLVNWPAGQSRQEVEPGLGWYLPLKQELHSSPAAAA
jgi:hypothetical protein